MNITIIPDFTDEEIEKQDVEYIPQIIQLVGGMAGIQDQSAKSSKVDGLITEKYSLSRKYFKIRTCHRLVAHEAANCRKFFSVYTA